jgi:hypothetical protein
MTIITGESLQELADLYLGLREDFLWNPRITPQYHKQGDLNLLVGPIENPPTIFCNTHRIGLLAEKIQWLTRPFVLITHNSDDEIRPEDPAVWTLLEYPRLLGWFAQNLCMNHPKLRFLPIGIANRQWNHGYDAFVAAIAAQPQPQPKTREVYMCFELATQPIERGECIRKLSPKLTLLDKLPPAENWRRISQYKFAICPVGNGIDTHRFWECLYLHCVPIVVRNPLIEILLNETRLPMVILERWEDFDITILPDYTEFDFDCPELTIEYYKAAIETVAAADKSI